MPVTSWTLTELHEILERGEGVPEAWLVEQAPSGDLRMIWAASQDPRVLLSFAARFAKRPVVVSAACKVAATVVHLTKPDDPRPRRVLTTVERWARGEASDEDVSCVKEIADDLRREARESASSAYAVDAIAHTAGLALEDRRFVGSAASEVAACAAMAVAAAAEEAGTTLDSFVERDEHLAVCARVIRDQLPWPSLDQLLADFTG